MLLHIKNTEKKLSQALGLLLKSNWWFCSPSKPSCMFNSVVFLSLLWSLYGSQGLSVHPSLFLCVLAEYLEVVWRSLASENAECPLLVKKASDTLVELLKDPKTYDNITKDFKYSVSTLCHPHLLHPVASKIIAGFQLTESLDVRPPKTSGSRNHLS